ncbi:MAG TPA: thermostable hemolysin delta-VPH, partial [Clostridiales bacterium]|nr:thermostable hemolysin delta-VPH [Clostridiales bacterium]
MYYNYHGQAKKRIREGKLIEFYFTSDYKGIRPALVLVFPDKVMPIRQYRWE